MIEITILYSILLTMPIIMFNVIFQCWKEYTDFLKYLIKATGKQIRIVCNTMIFILVFCRIQIQEHRFLSICRNHKANKHCHWVWNWFLRSLNNQRKHLHTRSGLIHCLVVVVSCRIFCPLQSASIHRLIITNTFISFLYIYTYYWNNLDSN